MPYTVKELKENEYWQKLHEQDRVDYRHKLQQAMALQNVDKIIDPVLGKVPIEKVKPLRNEGGTFLAFEDPDTGLNYNRPDQYITVDKKSPTYHTGELRDKVLDREIKELV